MTDDNSGTTLLFLITGQEWLDQSAHMIKALDPLVPETLIACPDEPSEQLLELFSEAKVFRYDACSGVSGVLAQLHRSEEIDPNKDLLVVSDQLLGPLASVSLLLNRTAAKAHDSELEKMCMLAPPDSRDAYTESAELTTADKAGALAMELTWFLVPSSILKSSDFWSSLERTASLKLADRGWLGLFDLKNSLESDGIAVEFLLSGSGDFFARDIDTYVDQGIPFVPWALFTTDPLVLERWAIVPRRAFEYLKEAGYPTSLFWSRVVNECAPQTWYTNLSLLDIFPSSSPAGFDNTQKMAVIIHVYYPEMLNQILHYAGNVPDPVKLVITTDSEVKKQAIESELSAQERFADWEVRIVSTNQGRDVSAFLLDCADILLDPDFDVVLKLHTKRSVQDPASVSGWFKDHLFENLLASRGHVEHIMRRFQDEPELGIVMPPVVHMGVPTMGNGWTLNECPARELAPRVRVDIPFDDFTPLSPYGSMFFARREALLPLVQANFKASEFPDAEGYRDGSLAHVLERLFSYVVFSGGYFGRCVQTPRLAEVSAVTLQYKYDRVSHYLFPFALRQVMMLSGGGEALSGAHVRSLVQRQLSARYPRVGAFSVGLWHDTKRVVRLAQRSARRLKHLGK